MVSPILSPPYTTSNWDRNFVTLICGNPELLRRNAPCHFQIEWDLLVSKLYHQYSFSPAKYHLLDCIPANMSTILLTFSCLYFVRNKVKTVNKNLNDVFLREKSIPIHDLWLFIVKYSKSKQKRRKPFPAFHQH